MKAFVFTDESLREQAGRFVWLELNVDRAENAGVRKQLGVQALPTYFVVDPESERIVLRWIGGTTVEQLGHLLDSARENVRNLRSAEATLADDVRSDDPADVDGGTGTGRPGAGSDAHAATADELLARADLLYGEGRGEEAASLYRRSIESAPPDWPAYSRAVEALLLAWLLGGSCDEAVLFAKEVHPRLANSSSVAIVASVGLDCALELPDEDPAKAELVTYFERACRGATEDLGVPMAADDRSGLYISRLSARRAAQDSVGAREVAETWIEFLDREAERAPVPEARTVFDSHRLFACRELGTAERAIPFLERSEADFPDDYNPPARLARVYADLERWDDALAASERAVALAYGPRLVSLLGSRSDFFLSSGDSESARATLLQAIETAEALPEAQRSERRITALREKLSTIP